MRSNEKFHGRSIEEIVDLRFKEWEMRQRKEREDQEAAKKRFEENKVDVTKKPEPAPAHAPARFVAIKKWLHDHHVIK